jgi:hypothetical protein
VERSLPRSRSAWARASAATSLAALGLSGAPAYAEAPPVPAPPEAEGPADPATVRGIDRRALTPGDSGREAAAGVLLVPREFIRLVFLTSGVTAGLIRDEHVVPRVEQLLSPRPGSYSVLPQLFLDSSRRPSVGAQLLGSSRFAAMRLAVGFGGIHDLLSEARLRIALPRPLPFVLTVEGLADTRSALQYLGVGQDPDTDPRNHFIRFAPTHEAVYFEERERAIFELGARATNDLEVLLSSSLLRTVLEDTPGGRPASIVRVFQPGSVPGAPVATATTCLSRAPSQVGTTALPVAVPCPVEGRLSYTELALRFDTRASKGRPSPGVLLEAYGGVTAGLGGDPTNFYRLGGRAAGFISVRRRSNILSPKIAIDGIAAPPTAPPVPFTELVNQPDFRGIDSRVDKISVVYSLDYRWSMIRYLGPRLFIDAAQVGPDMATAFKVVPRVAGGFGVDLFSDDTELAQAMMSFSTEGVRVLFAFGVPTQFGDRQHRR